MQPEIRTVPLGYTIFGHSLRHDPAKRFGEEIMTLLNRVWPVLKANNIPNDGINRVVYEGDCSVFAGDRHRREVGDLSRLSLLERLHVSVRADLDQRDGETAGLNSLPRTYGPWGPARPWHSPTFCFANGR